MWTTDESMPEEELHKAEEKSYRLPEEIRLLDVEFPGGLQIATGTATIRFYKKGYSDSAIIHIEHMDKKHFSYRIEPFMPNITLHEKHVTFGG